MNRTANISRTQWKFTANQNHEKEITEAAKAIPPWHTVDSFTVLLLCDLARTTPDQLQDGDTFVIKLSK